MGMQAETDGEEMRKTRPKKAKAEEIKSLIGKWSIREEATTQNTKSKLSNFMKLLKPLTNKAQEWREEEESIPKERTKSEEGEESRNHKWKIQTTETRATLKKRRGKQEHTTGKESKEKERFSGRLFATPGPDWWLSRQQFSSAVSAFSSFSSSFLIWRFCVSFSVPFLLAFRGVTG